MRDFRLGALLALAFGLVVAGVWQWSQPAGFVAAGVLLAVWSLLFLLDTPARSGEGGDEP